MKNTIKKEFENEKWQVALNNAERFILDYGLDLIRLDVKHVDNKFIVTLEYGLGVRNS